MMKKSHLALGVLSAVSLTGAAALPWEQAAMLTAGAAAGSVLPDFDLRLGIPHRGVTHWLIWPALLWFLVPSPIIHGLALGWAAHLLADCLTVEGLRPLWPLPLRLAGPIKTGGLLETLTVLPLCGLLAYNIFYLVLRL